MIHSLHNNTYAYICTQQSLTCTELQYIRVIKQYHKLSFYCHHTSIQHIIRSDVKLVSQSKDTVLHLFANKQRITFSLQTNIFFQNSSFLIGSIIKTGRQGLVQNFNTPVPICIEYLLNGTVPSNVNSTRFISKVFKSPQVSHQYIRLGSMLQTSDVLNMIQYV